jgi:tight adherence protein C
MITLDIDHTAEIWVLVAAVAATLLSGLYRWRIAERDRLQRLRLDGFRGAVPVQAGGTPWYRQLGSSIAASPFIGTVEQERLLKLLVSAGIKGRGILSNFIAMKVCGAVILGGLVWIGLELGHLLAGAMIFRLAGIGAAFMLGWRLPDFVLGHIIKRRRLRLEQGMPDALDLMVICAESGLSLNQSVETVGRELRRSQKDVAEEFATTSAEMQVLSEFGDALDNLVERTGLSDLRSLVATLKQSLKFGTPLAESLRTIAAEMRATRQARYEQRAARLPVLLAIPMMVFILPCLLMVVGTPVVLRLIEVFQAIHVSVGAP